MLLICRGQIDLCITYAKLNSVVVIGLIVAALRWGQPGRITRVLLILTLLAILGFPWFFRYEPAVSAAPGYVLRWPTQPGLLEGVAKRARITTEQRPCTYTLLGWSADASLYYRADLQRVRSDLAV